MTCVRILVISLAAFVALCLPSLAQASPQAVIRDCADDGSLDGKYSNDDLRSARDNLPADLDEYSDCREVIGAAINDGGGHKGAAGGTGGPRRGGQTGAAKAERKRDKAALARAARRRQKPRLEVGGQTVEPSGNGLFELRSAANGIPLPLLLAVIALGLLGATGGFLALRRRIPALARLSLVNGRLARLRRQ